MPGCGMEILFCSGLVAAGAAAYGGYMSLKVPEELQDIPQVSTARMFASFLRGEPFNVAFETLVKPVLDKEGIASLFIAGEWMLVLSDAKQVREILAENNRFLKRREMDPSHDSHLLTRLIGWSNIFFSDGAEWRRHRRVANPAFKKSWPVAIFSECVNDVIARIDADGGVVMAQELFQNLTLDALGKGLFSHDFESIKRGEDNHHLMVYHDVMRDVSNPLYITFPVLEKWVPSRAVSRSKADEFRLFLKRIIDERRQEVLDNNEKDDLLTMMIKASNSDSLSLDDEDVINDLAVFFLAGHDTTANTLTTTFYYLAKHQDIQERARREVIDALGDNSLPVPSLEKLKTLEYLNCIIKESMRIVTTIPIIGRRVPDQETLSSGLVIPKDTTVLLHAWALHHDPDVFKDPYTFNPDRFLDPHGPESTHWMAFGSGSRKCKSSQPSFFTHPS
ncbi:hypothetical protein DSO57_1004255 [Entomophthora muscae]|uniref:Uncharacterized protein n=1 Tax=Entomophthora muscae TaxID=34485 RepID=A0ACC2SA49_9FUNG|nr:hypothetical protein DSO57_1004255 [Entomophthora muscae]